MTDLITRAQASLVGVPDHIWPVTWVTVKNGAVTTHERPMSVSSSFTEAFGSAYIPAASRQLVPELIAQAIADKARIAELEGAYRRGIEDAAEHIFARTGTQWHRDTLFDLAALKGSTL